MDTGKLRANRHNLILAESSSEANPRGNLPKPKFFYQKTDYFHQYKKGADKIHTKTSFKITTLKKFALLGAKITFR